MFQTDLYQSSLSVYKVNNQDSLLVKRRNDNHSPGSVIREQCGTVQGVVSNFTKKVS